MTQNADTILDLAQLSVYSAAIKAVAILTLTRETLTEDQKKANEDGKGKLSEAIKAFAAKTAEDGIDPQLANTIMRQGLTLSGVPKGTALNYGRAVEGFRKLASVEGADVTKLGVKDAQDAMRSDAQVALDTLRDELKPFIRDANVDQLRAILALAKETITVKERKTRSDKAASVEPIPSDAQLERHEAAA